MSLPPVLPPPPPAPPEKPRPPFPTWMQAVALCGLLMVLSIAVSVTATIPWAVYGLLTIKRPLEPPVFVLGLTNVVAYALVFLVARAWSKRRFTEFFPFRRVRWTQLAPMSVAVLGFGILTSELANLVNYLVEAPEWLLQVFEGLVEDPISGLLIVVVVAPLTEELLFRGIILRGFAQNYRTVTAVLLSSLLFGIIHLNPYQFGGAFLLGVLFAWWRLETGSLLPCLYGHALNNALPFVLAYVVQLDIPGYTNYTDETQFQPLWFDALGLVMATAGVLWSRAMFRALPAPPLDWQEAGD